MTATVKKGIPPILIIGALFFIFFYATVGYKIKR